MPFITTRTQQITQNMTYKLKKAQVIFCKKTTLKTFFKALLDQFLMFQQYVYCSDRLLPNRKVLGILVFLTLSTDSYLFMILYVSLIAFVKISVALGKSFPQTIGKPLTGFYKRYATRYTFEKYCGNPFSAMTAEAAKLLNASSGKMVVVVGDIFVVQDIWCKTGSQVLKFEYEKMANGGTHRLKKAFLFDKEIQSWADVAIRGLARLPDKPN